MMTRVRRSYTREYKVRAVKLVTEGEISLAQVARDLGINANMLTRWKKQYLTDKENAFPKRGRPRASETELERLRRENADLKQERDMLRKAAVLLAKNLG
jgi:transposase